MRDNLTFTKVLNQESYDSTRQFAESFSHEVSPTMPLVTVARGDTMIGYYQVLSRPVPILAFHPKTCSPRDFIEMAEAVKNWQLQDSLSAVHPQGIAYTLVSPGTVIPEEAINRVGLYDTGLKLYQTK